MRELGKHHAPQQGLGGARRILVSGVTGSGTTIVAAGAGGTTGIPRLEPVTPSQTDEQVG